VGNYFVTCGSHNELRAVASGKRTVKLEEDGRRWGMVTRKKATCKTSVIVKVNGILKFLGQSKFGGLTVLEHLNHARADTVLVMAEH
jgi:hypothetical protein